MKRHSSGGGDLSVHDETTESEARKVAKLELGELANNVIFEILSNALTPEFEIFGNQANIAATAIFGVS